MNISHLIKESKLCQSAGRALGAVMSKDLDYKTYTQLYRSCVCPVLDYGAGVWGYCKQTHSEKVQCRSMRSFLGVHKKSTKLALNGDMGHEPWDMSVRWCGYGIGWLICQTLAKHIFNWSTSHKTTWRSQMEKIFEDVDLQFVYRNKLCNINQIRKIYFWKWNALFVLLPLVLWFMQWIIFRSVFVCHAWWRLTYLFKSCIFILFLYIIFEVAKFALKAWERWKRT